MRRKPCLTSDDVHKIVAACKKAGENIKREPTDAGGHLRHLEPPDRNGVNTVDMATLKARTAALRGRPRSAFESRVKDRPGLLMVPNCLGVAGGMAILFEDECPGGVGVSGSDHDDEPVALAGAEALKGASKTAESAATIAPIEARDLLAKGLAYGRGKARRARRG